MRRKRVRVGDVFEIRLSGGRKAFGQYVFRDSTMGPLIQVYDLIVEGEVQPDEVLARLKEAKPLFRPVITGLYAAVRTGFWTVIGRLPIGEFIYPNFISVYYENDRPLSFWFLWNGERWIKLGYELPEEYKHLEFLVVWDPHDVVVRIETGKNPYERLIRGDVGTDPATCP